MQLSQYLKNTIMQYIHRGKPSQVGGRSLLTHGMPFSCRIPQSLQKIYCLCLMVTCDHLDYGHIGPPR